MSTHMSPEAALRAAGVGSMTPADLEWPEPLDLFGDPLLVAGEPVLRPDHLPDAIASFVFDTAARLGVDPSGVAIVALVALAATMDDRFRIQPRRVDDSWTEAPRIWGAIVGDPSVLKSPVISACTRPIDRLEASAREQHAEDMRRHKADLAAWKKAGADETEKPRTPRMARWMVEGTTVEALTEILRDDEKAAYTALARKVLIRQDELSEWVGAMDRYRSGGNGGSDRGAYLRLYNGGSYVVDRIGRGYIPISSWSACIVGGIQPDPLRRIANQTHDDGLLQRFMLIVPSTHTEGEDRRPDRTAMDRYSALFPALAAMHPEVMRGEERLAFTLHADAHGHREQNDQLARAVMALPDISGRIKAALGKWPGLFSRLALVFHLMEQADARASGEAMSPLSPVVQEATARRVAGLMKDVLLPHLFRAESVIGESAGTGHARWIAGFILSQGCTRITARDISRGYKPLRAPEQRRVLNETMVSLEVFGWVRAEQPENIARPIIAWQVNPRVAATFADRAQLERESRQRARTEVADIIRRKKDACA
jgi:hypothetical protein